MESKNSKERVPLISKTPYGFGDVGCNFSCMFVSNFLMIFYTDVFGISMAAVSWLMLFSRFWDAINDAIIGGLTDKTKTKWGRYRSVAAMIAIGIINIITVPLITTFGKNSAQTGYLTVAIIYGCIFAAWHFFCFAKTREVVQMPEKEKISLKV